MIQIANVYRGLHRTSFPTRALRSTCSLGQPPVKCLKCRWSGVRAAEGTRFQVACISPNSPSKTGVNENVYRELPCGLFRALKRVRMGMDPIASGPSVLVAYGQANASVLRQCGIKGA